MKTVYDTITFDELSSMDENTFGMVIVGAGGKSSEWVGGITKILKKEKIVNDIKPIFSRAAKITGNVLGEDGRTDLVLIFNKDVDMHVGKLAMWRLAFRDVSWMDDFVVNFRKDYN
jgi:hypothetical protein